MFDLIPNLIAAVLTVLFPVFASYKALRTSDPAQLSPWLMYWVSFALFALFEDYTYWLLGWLPLYGTLRLLFLLYLVLPQTQGARLAYQQYIHPFLAHNERQIEESIGDVHAKLQALGLDHLTQLIEFVKRNVLGMQPSPSPSPSRIGHRSTSGSSHHQHGGASSGSGGATYAQNLLSRFNLPTAREGMAAPAGDLYGLLSAASSILGGGSGSGGQASRRAQADELARSGSLIPNHVRTPSERARFVDQQRERLTVLLHALDREAPPGYGRGGEDEEDELSRNRSEVSFDRIEDDELLHGREAHREGKAGWFGWAKENARASGIDLAYGDER